MRLLHFSPTKTLLSLAAVALTACAPLAPSSGRPSPEMLQTLSSSTLPDKPSALQSQQWLDRVTWGATDHDAARLQQQGLKRWLAAQLSPSSAPMPTEVQQHIDALGISQKPMAQIQREIADQRLAIRNSQSSEEAAKLRSELQRQLNQHALGQAAVQIELQHIAPGTAHHDTAPAHEQILPAGTGNGVDFIGQKIFHASGAGQK